MIPYDTNYYNNISYSSTHYMIYYNMQTPIYWTGLTIYAINGTHITNRCKHVTFNAFTTPCLWSALYRGVWFFLRGGGKPPVKGYIL